MNKVEKIVNSLKSEGVMATCKRTYYRLYMELMKQTSYTSADTAHWESLRSHVGGEVYVIGNGPSLNKTPLYLLKGKTTLCFNHFHIMEERINWNPTFFMATDYLVIKDLIDEGFEKVINDCQYCVIPKVHQQGIRFDKQISPNDKIYWLRIKGTGGYSNVMPDVYGSGSVVYPAIQVLNYLGFEKIILLGVDMNYKIQDTAKNKSKYYNKEVTASQDDDPNHFDSRYFGKGKSFHQPKADIMQAQKDSFDYIGRNQKKYGTNIINVGYDSMVESFPKQDFIESLGLSKDEIKTLFEELLVERSPFASISDFYEKCKCYHDEEELGSFTDLSFYTSLDTGLSILKKVISTHLPLGPYDGKYFFVKREV